MKKLIFIGSILLQVTLRAQTIPNGTFETWTSMAYADPTGWNTGNFRDIQGLGVSTITKVTGYAGFAVRLETHVVGTDTSESYIINTDAPCSDPEQWTGGVPYSQQPTAITGYFRYNLPGNDTALLIVIFRKNGVHIGDNFIPIRGTGSQLTFAPFSFPVNCSGVPDTIIIAAASSNKMTNQGVQNGSFLELDNLGFAGTTQSIPGGDFDTWSAKSFDRPNGWETWNSGVSKTSASYSGSAAVRLETIDECGGGNANSSGITTGHMTSNNGPAGGRPFTNMIDTLCGYYKYTPMGNDSAMVVVNISKNHNNIAGNMLLLAAAANYTYFEIPLWVSGALTPDTMRVDIVSSSWSAAAANAGSILYVDNVQLKSQPLGIAENELPVIQSIAYPNPVGSTLNVQLNKSVSGWVEWRVYDLTGKVVISASVNDRGALCKFPVDTLKTGMYFYEIKSAVGTARNKFIKE